MTSNPLNVLLLTVDCLRYDRCGFNGHHIDTTPNLDSLASESYIFDHAFSSGPNTPESFPGILAGRHSFRSAFFDAVPWKALHPDSETLAGQLEKSGYDTFATITNSQLIEERNWGIGFDSFRNLQTAHTDGDTTFDDKQSPLYSFLDRMEKWDSRINPYTPGYVAFRYLQSRNEWPSIRADQLSTEFLRDLDRHHIENPFFAWGHFMDVHAPIHPSTMKSVDIGPQKNAFSILVDDVERVSRAGHGRYEKLYDCAVRYVDENVGKVVEELKAIGEWDNTILILTGDHGEMLFDRNDSYGHPRHHMHNESLHVPLLVRVPGIDGKRIEAPFSLAWLHELVDELVDVELEPLPAQSGRTSHIKDPEPATLISDAIDETGHTISVFDNKNKFITTNRSGPLKHPTFEETYDNQDVVYRYLLDKGERVPFEAQAEDVDGLSEVATDIRTEADSLKQVTGELNRELRDRLADLGYR
ncbi:sulfatase [Haloferax volcanii]|uniref:sulfatase n=1 Tax=Haloferax volcanii TaxID=2246 RepID=UPI0038597285